MGFYANILADVAKRRKLADVQIRLIMKSLEDFEGTAGGFGPPVR